MAEAELGIDHDVAMLLIAVWPIAERARSVGIQVEDGARVVSLFAETVGRWGARRLAGSLTGVIRRSRDALTREQGEGKAAIVLRHGARLAENAVCALYGAEMRGDGFCARRYLDAWSADAVPLVPREGRQAEALVAGLSVVASLAWQPRSIHGPSWPGRWGGTVDPAADDDYVLEFATMMATASRLTSIGPARLPEAMDIVRELFAMVEDILGWWGPETVLESIGLVIRGLIQEARVQEPDTPVEQLLAFGISLAELIKKGAESPGVWLAGALAEPIRLSPAPHADADVYTLAIDLVIIASVLQLQYGNAQPSDSSRKTPADAKNRPSQPGRRRTRGRHR